MYNLLDYNQSPLQIAQQGNQLGATLGLNDAVQKFQTGDPQQQQGALATMYQATNPGALGQGLAAYPMQQQAAQEGRIKNAALLNQYNKQFSADVYQSVSQLPPDQQQSAYDGYKQKYKAATGQDMVDAHVPEYNDWNAAKPALAQNYAMMNPNKTTIQDGVAFTQNPAGTIIGRQDFSDTTKAQQDRASKEREAVIKANRPGELGQKVQDFQGMTPAQRQLAVALQPAGQNLTVPNADGSVTTLSQGGPQSALGNFVNMPPAGGASVPVPQGGGDAWSRAGSAAASGANNTPVAPSPATNAPVNAPPPQASAPVPASNNPANNAAGQNPISVSPQSGKIEGGSVVQLNGLAQGITADVQKEVLKNNNSLNSSFVTQQFLNPDNFSLTGKVGNWANRIADYLSPANTQSERSKALQVYTTGRAVAGTAASQYKKEMTGVSANPQETKDYAQNILSPTDTFSQAVAKTDMMILNSALAKHAGKLLVAHGFAQASKPYYDELKNSGLADPSDPTSIPSIALSGGVSSDPKSLTKLLVSEGVPLQNAAASADRISYVLTTIRQKQQGMGLQ